MRHIEMTVADYKACSEERLDSIAAMFGWDHLGTPRCFDKDGNPTDPADMPGREGKAPATVRWDAEEIAADDESRLVAEAAGKNRRRKLTTLRTEARAELRVERGDI